MSIHSLAKELGVSEYVLRQYAREHNINRKSSVRRSGYEFSKEDLARIKKNYTSKPEPVVLILMYRIYDKKNRNHLYLPAGYISKIYENLLNAFISYQYSSSNDFHKKCYNFFICSKQQFNTRLKKLQTVMGDFLFNKTISELAQHFITSEKLPALVSEKKRIGYEEFVPQCARDFFTQLQNSQSPAKMEAVSIDEEIENEIGSYDENITSIDQNDAPYNSDEIDFS